MPNESLVININLIKGRYEAGGWDDPSVAEWPPHPARVFCALVASARCEDDYDVLRWLEKQPPPVVQAARDFDDEHRKSYVVVNENLGYADLKAKRKKSSPLYLARTMGIRTRHLAVPTNPHIRIVWSDVRTEWPIVDLDSAIARLDSLARRAPYLGRSTSVAILSVEKGSANDTSVPGGLTQFNPTPETRNTQYLLRVPYEGYLDSLQDIFEKSKLPEELDDQPKSEKSELPGPLPLPWMVSYEVGYQVVDNESTKDTLPEDNTFSPIYTDMIVLRFSKVRPDGRLTAMFTKALRNAVMSVTDIDPLPEALHGHNGDKGRGTDGKPHVAFLPLPNVGNTHADGHLLGMAVAIPKLDERERRAIIRGILDGLRTGVDDMYSSQRLLRLNVPRIGQVDLVYQPDLIHPWGARRERWTRTSKCWVSATPVVLDRYPRKNRVEAEIVQSCKYSGLPEPSDIIVSPSPLIAGGIAMYPRDIPAKFRNKLFYHVKLCFSQEVPGPVLLGAGRYLGIGLMAPLIERKD